MSFVNNKKRKNENENNDINESNENQIEKNTNKIEKKKKEKQNDNNNTEEYVVKRDRRDFVSDLEEYIKGWTLKSGIITPADDSIKWKFNKVLQSWAIDHCLHESSIPSPLFYSCIPYFQSVKGVARIRMTTLAQDIINDKGNNINNINNNNEKDNDNNDNNREDNKVITSTIEVDQLTKNKALFLLEKLKE